MERNLFEYASRTKLRIETPKGVASTEELWGMGLIELNELFKVLNKVKKEQDETESLLDEETKEDIDLLVSIGLLKHIVGVKKAEVKATLDAQANAAKKQKIMEAIAKKEEVDYDDAELDDLKKMLDELN